MSFADTDEQALVKGLQEGSREAFRLLLERHERRVYNLAYRMLDHNRQDAEDATQETFVEVYRSINRFAGRSRLDTWIHRIAVNVCLQRRRRKTLPTAELADTGELVLPDPSPDGNPERKAVQADLRAQLARAVAELPDGQREVVLLHGMQGLSYSEVAEALDCPIGTVKSRLSTAFRRLRGLLPHLAEEVGAAPEGAS